MKLEVKNKLGQVYYTATYNEQDGWFESNWFGYVSSEEVIEAVQQVMVAFKEIKYTKSLNDSSKSEGSWDEANDWLAKNWMPDAIANGLKKFAFIVSEDIFSSMATEEMATRVPGTLFEMRTFQTKAEAENWLRAA